jgi:hypothetical protein
MAEVENRGWRCYYHGLQRRGELGDTVEDGLVRMPALLYATQRSVSVPASRAIKVACVLWLPEVGLLESAILGDDQLDVLQVVDIDRRLGEADL